MEVYAVYIDRTPRFSLSLHCDCELMYASISSGVITPPVYYIFKLHLTKQYHSVMVLSIEGSPHGFNLEPWIGSIKDELAELNFI